MFQKILQAISKKRRAKEVLIDMEGQIEIIQDIISMCRIAGKESFPISFEIRVKNITRSMVITAAAEDEFVEFLMNYLCCLKFKMEAVRSEFQIHRQASGGYGSRGDGKVDL